MPRTLTLIISGALLALLMIVASPTVSHRTLEAGEPAPAFLQVTAEDRTFQIGEELVYNVSYSIFDIGSIKMQILDTSRRNGVMVYKAKAFADSYSGLPFVDLHQVFYTEMDEDAFSQFFITHNTGKPAKMPYVKYTYNYKKNKMMYEMGTEPGPVIYKTGEEPVMERHLDGLSLFFYARKNFQQTKKYSVPVLVNEKSFKTHFNFMNKSGEQDIDAVKYPVRIVEFDGTSDFTGVFGLTGYFQGYFSDDEAGIPIVAKMKVILGSVHIELMKWNRPGWAPPKAL